MLAIFWHLAWTHRVSLLEVEDEVQLAHVPKVAVQHFDIAMDDLEGRQLVVVLTDPCDEEEGCVPTVDYFGICEVESVLLVSALPYTQCSLTERPRTHLYTRGNCTSSSA